MAKHPPAYQYYPSDFDASTRHWTPAEVGCYQRLLNHQWINGYLPLDRLHRIAGADREDWPDIWETLSEKFEIEDGRLVNERLESVRAEQIAYREERARSGRKGGLAKAQLKAKPEQSKPKASGSAPSKKVALQSSSSPLPTTTTLPPPKTAFEVPIPEDLSSNGFREKWAEWLDYRAEMKKPVTARAAKAQLAKLAKRPETAKDTIDNSIANDWQGLFPEKVKPADLDSRDIDWSQEEGA